MKLTYPTALVLAAALAAALCGHAWTALGTLLGAAALTLCGVALAALYAATRTAHAPGRYPAKRKGLAALVLALCLTLGLLPALSGTAYADGEDITSNIFIRVSDECSDDNRTISNWSKNEYTVKEGVTITFECSKWWTNAVTIYLNGTAVATWAGSADYSSTYVWTAKKDAKINWAGYDQYNANIYLTETVEVSVTGVTLSPSAAQTITVGDSVAFTATVAPDNATDKTVKWSVSDSAVKLYSDSDCTTEIGADATSTLTVYAKGESVGNATVTVTSNADSTKSASCVVTVNAATPSYTVTAGVPTTDTGKKYHNGENITIAVTVSGGAFEGGEFTLTYDKDMFQLTAESVAPGKDDTDAKNTKTNQTGENSNGQYDFSLNNGVSFADGESLVNLTFTVVGNVSAETEYSFAFQNNTASVCYGLTKDTVEATTVTGATVTVKPKFTVTVTPDYVTGYSLITVANTDVNTEDTTVYAYGDTAMYYVNAYKAYACIVSGTVEQSAAEAAVKVGTASVGTIENGETDTDTKYDVNGTGKVDYSDSLLTYRCYLVKYEDPVSAMEIYLRADVNGNKKVDTTDVSEIDANRTTQEAPSA